MQPDYIFNGEGFGAMGHRALDVGANPEFYRPFIDKRGERCVVMNVGMRQNTQTGEYEPHYKKVKIKALWERGINNPVLNATTLTKQAWQFLDAMVVKATRTRLRAWADLAASSSRGGFNAYAKSTFEYQAMSDPGEAVVSMSGISPGRRDTPLFKLRSVPLPITHSDFWYDDREIAISKENGQGLDTEMAEASIRRVMETIEDTLIGTVTGVTYGTQSAGAGAHDGNSTVYGYTNWTHRVTKTDLTAPTGSNPEAVMTDVLEMIETMQTNGYFGPYMLYHSTGYSRYLSDDYYRSGSTSAVRSLRERVMQIEGIADIRRLDRLTGGFQLILVNLDGEKIQAINGMAPTVTQWDSEGGFRKNFKVWAIQVPLLKAPYNGTGGVIHGTTS